MTKMKLLDFTADWCGTCKVVDTLVEKEIVPKIRNKIDFKKIDVEKDRKLTEKHNILSVPTLILVTENGVEIWRKSGHIFKDEVIKELNKVVK